MGMFEGQVWMAPDFDDEDETVTGSALSMFAVTTAATRKVERRPKAPKRGVARKRRG